MTMHAGNAATELHVEMVFLDEIARQCDYALSAASAADSIQKVLALHARLPVHVLQELFRNLHSFLTHAGNASRILFPPERHFKEGTNKHLKHARVIGRSLHLRNVLQIGSDSPLADRTLRNHLEHYDERLSEWVDMSKGHVIATDNIGSVEGLDIGDTMRSYDPATGKFHFRGEAYDLVLLAKTVSSARSAVHVRLTELQNDDALSVTE